MASVSLHDMHESCDVDPVARHLLTFILLLLAVLHEMGEYVFLGISLRHLSGGAVHLFAAITV